MQYLYSTVVIQARRPGIRITIIYSLLYGYCVLSIAARPVMLKIFKLLRLIILYFFILFDIIILYSGLTLIRVIRAGPLHILSTTSG